MLLVQLCNHIPFLDPQLPSMSSTSATAIFCVLRFLMAVQRKMAIPYLPPSIFSYFFPMFHITFSQFSQAFPKFTIVFLYVSYFRFYGFKIYFQTLITYVKEKYSRALGCVIKVSNTLKECFSKQMGCCRFHCISQIR